MGPLGSKSPSSSLLREGSGSAQSQALLNVVETWHGCGILSCHISMQTFICKLVLGCIISPGEEGKPGFLLPLQGVDSTPCGQRRSRATGWGGVVWHQQP